MSSKKGKVSPRPVPISASNTDKGKIVEPEILECPVVSYNKYSGVVVVRYKDSLIQSTVDLPPGKTLQVLKTADKNGNDHYII